MTELPREEALRRAQNITGWAYLDIKTNIADAIQQAYRDGAKAAAQRCAEIAGETAGSYGYGREIHAVGAEAVGAAIRREFALPEVTK